MKSVPATTLNMWADSLPDGARYPDVNVVSAKHGSYTLEGRILGPRPNTDPSVLMIHGARADYSKADAIIRPLSQLGATILNVTVSGHGSKGYNSEHGFSLDDNLEEARAFASLIGDRDNVIIGQSMGGTTAVRLIESLPENKFSKLILFYPAVFPDEVYSVPFGTDEFRKIASVRHAFLTSSFFETLRTFKGKIMLIRGEYDGLSPGDYGKPEDNSVFTTQIGDREVYSPIPPEVFSRILEVRPDTEYLIIEGADHQFAKWYATRAEQAKDLAEKMYMFISSEK